MSASASATSTHDILNDSRFITWSPSRPIQDPSIDDMTPEGTNKLFWSLQARYPKMPNLPGGGVALPIDLPRCSDPRRQNGIPIQHIMELGEVATWNIYGGSRDYRRMLAAANDNVNTRGEVPLDGQQHQRWDDSPAAFNYTFFPAVGVTTGPSVVFDAVKGNNALLVNARFEKNGYANGGPVYANPQMWRGPQVTNDNQWFGARKGVQMVNCVPYIVIYSRSAPSPGSAILPKQASWTSYTVEGQHFEDNHRRVVHVCGDLFAPRDVSASAAVYAAINCSNPHPGESYLWFMPFIHHNDNLKELSPMAYANAFSISGPSLGAAVFAAISGYPPAMYTGFLSASRLNRKLYGNPNGGVDEVIVPKSFDYIENVQLVGSKMWLAAMLQVPFVFPVQSALEGAIQTIQNSGDGDIKALAERFANQTGILMRADHVYTSLEDMAGKSFQNNVTPFLCATTLTGALTLAVKGCFYFGAAHHFQDLSAQIEDIYDDVADNGAMDGNRNLHRQAANQIAAKYRQRELNVYNNAKLYPQFDGNPAGPQRTKMGYAGKLVQDAKDRRTAKKNANAALRDKKKATKKATAPARAAARVQANRNSVPTSKQIMAAKVAGKSQVVKYNERHPAPRQRKLDKRGLPYGWKKGKPYDPQTDSMTKQSSSSPPITARAYALQYHPHGLQGAFPGWDGRFGRQRVVQQQQPRGGGGGGGAGADDAFLNHFVARALSQAPPRPQSQPRAASFPMSSQQMKQEGFFGNASSPSRQQIKQEPSVKRESSVVPGYKAGYNPKLDYTRNPTHHMAVKASKSEKAGTSRSATKAKTKTQTQRKRSGDDDSDEEGIYTSSPYSGQALSQRALMPDGRIFGESQKNFEARKAREARNASNYIVDSLFDHPSEQMADDIAAFNQRQAAASSGPSYQDAQNYYTEQQNDEDANADLAQQDPDLDWLDDLMATDPNALKSAGKFKAAASRLKTAGKLRSAGRMKAGLMSDILSAAPGIARLGGRLLSSINPADLLS